MGTNDARPVPNRNTATPTSKNTKYSKAMGRKTASENIRWSQVAGPLIKECIGFVTASGDAITFGRTTDGGALSVTILSGSERLKQYATTPHEAEGLLQAIIDSQDP